MRLPDRSAAVPELATAPAIAPRGVALGAGGRGLSLPKPSPLVAALICGGALAGIVACSFALAVQAAGHVSVYVPAVGSRPFPRWIAGPYAGFAASLTNARFFGLMVLMVVCYGAVIAFAGALRARWILAAIVLAHIAFLLGPPLLSTDVFSYMNYARLYAVDHLNPYVHPPSSAVADPSYKYVSVFWKHTLSAYGPVFTLGTYPLALLGLGGLLWSLKTLTVLASLGCVAVIWRAARLLGRSPLQAAILWGLNPVVLVYSVGGAHNDVLMLFLMALGVLLALRRREAIGAGGVVVAAAMKATGAVLLPFMWLGLPGRRRPIVVGAAGVVAVLAVASFAIFGSHALAWLSVVSHQQRMVSSDATPNQLAHLFGGPGVTWGVRLASRVVLVLGVGYALFRAWRGTDWIACAGWALLTLAATTTWQLAWYTIWPLPLAVLTRDRRLIAATLAFEGCFLIYHLGPLPFG